MTYNRIARREQIKNLSRVVPSTLAQMTASSCECGSPNALAQHSLLFVPRLRGDPCADMCPDGFLIIRDGLKALHQISESLLVMARPIDGKVQCFAGEFIAFAARNRLARA